MSDISFSHVIVAGEHTSPLGQTPFGHGDPAGGLGEKHPPTSSPARSQRTPRLSTNSSANSNRELLGAGSNYLKTAARGALVGHDGARHGDSNVEAELLFEEVRLAQEACIVARGAIAHDEVEADRFAHPRRDDLLHARAVLGVEAVC